ncbi:MAG TPA: hypothetical protein VLW44_08495 [Streptosporangiaceae bacterium]|nr:hypothetical protein [Streptosporangiaceae bacterium]HUL25799.1 hypothetical protein [Streptosporangiaceae bacterium]
MDASPPPDGPQPRAPVLRGLFVRHAPGDDAILRLARLRFAEAGMAAELYADTPEQLERELEFLPPYPALPLAHLSRHINLLREDGQGQVQAFVRQFRGRLLGVVVHDQAGMADRIPEVVTAARNATAGRAADGPLVFLEYASGMEPERFTELARQLASAEGASVCIDIGHVGIHESRRRLAASHPGLDLAALGRDAGDAPGLVADVQAAARSAREVVTEMIESVGAVGKPVHFHLHDGHPLIPGLADHFSFLTRLPVPFTWQGRSSLEPMYGLCGLRQVLAAIVRHCAAGGSSATLEVHQSEGRLPLGNAAGLFGHWQDLTDAERMNYWLSVLADNHLIATTMLDAIQAGPAGQEAVPYEGGDSR